MRTDCSGLDVCSFKEAGKKLELWFKENPAPHIEAREDEKAKPHPSHHTTDLTSPAIAVKGFLHDTGLWLDELLAPIVEPLEIRKTLKKTLMNRIHQSFLNGKSAG
ncbi:MAG TPA: hypothetical protein VGF82_08130 [Terracidiphilus sp.]|jgi:hypothetical protein